VGIYDNFFDVGGNSMSILRLNSRLKAVTGMDIPVVEMFRYPTIHSFSTYLSHFSRSEKRKAYSEEKIMKTVNSLDESLKLLMGDDNE
jgi:polyketide synthase PksJ